MLEAKTNQTSTHLPPNTWLFLEDAFLKASASRKQLTVSQELRTRESLHEFIVKLGLALKLDGKTILAATVYVNRFYMRMPITTSKYFVASAAVTISCKLNDTYRPPDSVARAACVLKNPHKTIDEHSEVFWQWRDQLLYREELILKNLNFELNLELPYAVRDELLREASERKEENDAKNSEKKDIEFDNEADGSVKPEEDSLFYSRISDILRNAVSLIEMLSLLPISVAYDVRTNLGAMLVVSVIEADQRFNTEGKLKVPKGYLRTHVGSEPKDCFRCYSYVRKLLKYCDVPDAKVASHKNLLLRIKTILKEAFYGAAGEDA